MRSFLIGTALCLSAAAASSAEMQPPRVLESPVDATDNCYRLHSRDGEVTGEAQVTVSVDAAGRVSGAMSVPGTAELLAAAAQCVAVAMKFGPALLDDQPVAGKITIAVGFPTPPKLRQDLRRAITYCQPAIQPLIKLRNAYEGELDLLVRVGEDGRVIDTVLPDGVLPWMEEAARCLKDRLDFYPARLRLEAVESWTMVMVDFNLTRNPSERVRLDSPTLRSTDEEILAAYRVCYPGGRTEQVKINYRITVTDGGRVRKAEVVASSGDAALDEAGVCILRKLIFVPARRNGVNVESTLPWPILVRPPH